MRELTQEEKILLETEHEELEDLQQRLRKQRRRVDRIMEALFPEGTRVDLGQGIVHGPPTSDEDPQHPGSEHRESQAETSSPTSA